MRRKDREVTDIGEMEEILRQCKICHVAMVDNGSPYVVPLSYGYRILADNVLELYFHSALEGKKLDILKSNGNVCFEMTCEGEPVQSETPCNSGYYYSSIIGFGQVVFADDLVEKCKALSIMFNHQSGREVIFTDEQAQGVCVFKVVSKAAEDYVGYYEGFSHIISCILIPPKIFF